MRNIRLLDRDLTQLELERMHQSFGENQLASGVPLTVQVRHNVIAVEDTDSFIGCASGLETDNHWFHLTDLWLEEAYRKRGLGTALLKQLETKLAAAGITDVYTWTAGYEAPGFYRRQGYELFCEFENYYVGSSRFGFRKQLKLRNT